MLSLKNVTKIYSRKQVNEDVIALDNVSLDLPDKGFVAILGASGSGKTTLLNIIGGLDKATSGNMIVDGLSTSDFTNKEWDSYRNHKIGFVLQNCYLLPHLNVRDNIAIKLQISHYKSKDINVLVDDALDRVGLSDKKFDKPKALSGGQKQRVAIARALVGNPTVILADEPTGALDSKTGLTIMELLKEASEDHLVVMVTHNNEYASKYADRVIELVDGKVVKDTAPVTNKKINEPKKLDKVSIPAKTTFKWGFKNLVIKKFTTLSIIIAAALGLTGVSLILSVSTGVQHVFDAVEASSFSTAAVKFSAYASNTPQGGGEDLKPYTDEQSVFVDYSSYTKQEHLQYMSESFLTYMRNMPTQYYVASYEKTYSYFNLYTQRNETEYCHLDYASSSFYKGINNTDFVSQQYDCLIGKYPEAENELALIIDFKNRVSVSYLYALGFDVNRSQIVDDKFSFADVLSKTYKYVPNDLYYEKNPDTGLWRTTSKAAKEMYNLGTLDLKITGILRQKPDNDNPLLSNGIIYTSQFEERVLTDSNNSQIVIEQKEYGLEKNVRTGNPFVDTATVAAVASYETALYQLGAIEKVTELNYYTKDYESRLAIKDYFSKYHFDKDVEPTTILQSDSLDKASAEFDGALKLMTTVLYVFAIVSIIVSAILNAILTFISTKQRINEIGLLRSLGARRIDIASMVETESVISGLFGGLFSILVTMLVISPVNVMITNAIHTYKFPLIYRASFELEGYQWWVAPIAIGIGVFTAFISALIPAIIASKKDPAKAINE